MIQLRMLEHRLLRYLGIAAGCFIASCSINLFLVPAHLLTGGATGIAIIFYYLAGLPIGLQTFLYNVPLLAAAWKTLGRGYTIDVVVGTAIFSFCLDITRVLNAYSPIQDVMLAPISAMKWRAMISASAGALRRIRTEMTRSAKAFMPERSCHSCGKKSRDFSEMWISTVSRFSSRSLTQRTI